MLLVRVDCVFIVTVIRRCVNAGKGLGGAVSEAEPVGRDRFVVYLSFESGAGGCGIVEGNGEVDWIEVGVSIWLDGIALVVLEWVYDLRATSTCGQMIP